jgi:hypothetical protein
MNSTHTGHGELVKCLARVIPNDGTIERLTGLHLRRPTSPTEMGHSTSCPSFCTIAQDSNEVLIGDRCYRYGT